MGGLIREFYDLLCNKIVHSGLFQNVNSFIKPNNNVAITGNELDQFRNIGSLIANAIIRKYPLNLPLSPSIYKSILGEMLSPDDLMYENPELFTSLCSLKNLDADTLQSLDLKFNVNTEDMSIVEIVPGGNTKSVVIDNCEEYVYQRCLWHIAGCN